MFRKYCTVHDSLWDHDDVCEAVFILNNSTGYDVHQEIEECQFIEVELVKKGSIRL